jgi:hypothetical protein
MKKMENSRKSTGSKDRDVTLETHDPARKTIRTPEIHAAGLMKEKINWFGLPT